MRSFGVITMLLMGMGLQAQFVVSDPVFAQRLQQAVPAAMNGNVLDTLHPSVTSLMSLNLNGSGVSNIDGIQYFNSLWTLYCQSNPNLTQLPSLPITLRWAYLRDCGLTALPALPPNLQELQCQGNALTSLPDLPVGLEILNCSGNPLSELPDLPPALVRLTCLSSGLSSLPELPATLRYLNCFSNELSQLPILPPSLEELECHYNVITELPELPESLQRLICEMNSLTVLPALPPSLIRLNFQFNYITSLPPLPGALRYLLCSNNPLQQLPGLPDQLYQLSCGGTALTCLPTLPNSLVHINTLNTQVNCLPNVPISFNQGVSNLGFPLTVCNVNTAPCPMLQPAFSGHLFHDDNSNGVRDPGEPAFPIGRAQAQPGGYLSAPDMYGAYVLPVSEGTHVISGRPVLYCELTTPANTVTLSSFQQDTLQDIGYHMIPGMYDLVVDMMGPFPRQGMDSRSWITVRNIGTETAETTVVLTLDPATQWVASGIEPSTISGGIAQWQVTLQPWQTWSTSFDYHTPYTVPGGSMLSHTTSATQSVPDQTPDNNAYVQELMVVYSCDPNDKAVVPETLTLEEGASGRELEYLVRFQNIGTAPALRVVITDTLDALLEPNTMELLSTSHPCTWYVQDRVLHVVYDPIFLPDSISDEPASHGAVKFSMRSVPGALPGTVISNVANIYFDFNEAVITNAALCAVQDVVGIEEPLPGTVMIRPNPVFDVLYLTSEVRLGSAEVFDPAGRCVLVSSDPIQGISVHALVPGTYVIRIVADDGVHYARFIKQ